MPTTAEKTSKSNVKRRLSEYGLFMKECFRHHRTTGAILPSGRRLARALARYVGYDDAPKHVLEVGPGTGAVTERIAANLGPRDRLDLVELNGAFVEQLQERLVTDRVFRPIAGRTKIFHCAVEDLPCRHSYDVIVSGLPLNNFTPGEVEKILGSMRDLLRSEGTLSFMEYIAIRYARAMVSGRRERERLRGITRLLDTLLDGYEIRREWIWGNVPPAWVHHVRFDPMAARGSPAFSAGPRERSPAPPQTPPGPIPIGGGDL